MTSTARSCQPSRAVKLALLCLGLLLLQPAMARKDDRQKQANIQSNSFDYTQADAIHYKGHVLLTQGTLKVSGDLATAYIDKGESITRVVVTGSPAHIQQLDDAGNLMQGDAGRIDYDNVKQIAVLTGNAEVKQKGRGDARGDKLTYNTRTSQMTGESGGDGLVHMTFQPKPKPAARSRPASGAVNPAPAQETGVPAANSPVEPASAMSSAPAAASSSSMQQGQP